MTEKEKRNQIRSADYSLFIRNMDNLRSELVCPNLLNSIQTLGYVTDPVIVSSELTEDGKFLILEGNRRHFALEQLLDQGVDVSPKLFYIQLTNTSEQESITVQLTYGAIDKRLEPLEYWKGVSRLIELIAENEYPGEDITVELKRQCIPQVSEIIGVSKQWINALFSLYEKGTDFLIDTIQARNISCDSAIILLRQVEKHHLDLDYVLEICLETALPKNKRVTEKIITDVVSNILETTKIDDNINTEEEENQEPGVNNNPEINRAELESQIEIYLDEISLQALNDKDLVNLEKLAKRLHKQQYS